jgi:hypothetical protein
MPTCYLYLKPQRFFQRDVQFDEHSLAYMPTSSSLPIFSSSSYSLRLVSCLNDDPSCLNDEHVEEPPTPPLIQSTNPAPLVARVPK